MNPKAEYVLILLVSILPPILIYPHAYSFIQKILLKDLTPYTFQTSDKNLVKPLSLLFVGDIMLDRTIRLNGETNGYTNLFACLEKDFTGHDAVIGNLEGTVTRFESVSAGAPYESPESFRFTFDPQAVKALVDIGLSIVSIGNNHIRDFGDQGISETLVHTNELGLVTFGDPRPSGQRYVIQEISDTKIAFIAYNQFFGSEEQTLADLKEAQNISDLQIVFSHWGDEYVPARNDTKIFARKFVDNGADLIIGSHPHVIQEREQYKDVWIYYSLGNFIFDQYWDDNVSTGLMVEVQIKNSKITITKESEVLSTRRTGTCIKKPTL